MTEKNETGTTDKDSQLASKDAQLINIVGIKFEKTGKIHDYYVNNLDLKLFDLCIVEIEKGLESGYVAKSVECIPRKSVKRNLKKVIRVANNQDIEHIKLNQEMGLRAKDICERKINERKIKMKLIHVKYTFDGNKAIFYFTAEGRIDFRDLVKELANEFKTRIEMRQIGVRDEAKILGGIGSCGIELCCYRFLHEFDPVSIKMAKDQNLTLNPNKISGICGRLMCCLSYEHQIYLEMKTKLPRIGDRAIFKGEEGRVSALDVLNEEAYVQLPDERVVKIKSPHLKNGKWVIKR